jgi:iron complex transport system substrate-binding protein
LPEPNQSAHPLGPALPAPRARHAFDWARSAQWLNTAAALLAVMLSTYAVARHAARGGAVAPAALELAARREPSLGADGRRELADASGHRLALSGYSRIASASSLADPLLRELCEDARIVAFSGRAALGPDAHHYAHKPAAALDRPEALLALKPDLVLVNSLGDYARAERLRELGLNVFDLGPMHGLATFVDNVLALGWLLDAEPRARRYAAQFVERMRAVAGGVLPEQRRSALYVGVYATQLFGGTLGSSYHDVLTHAGLVDAAATRFQGWPRYTPEQLLLLDPDVIVTHAGMRRSLCEGELSRLRACGGGRVVELEEALLNDAGVHMLDAAELVHDAVYGTREGLAR